MDPGSTAMFHTNDLRRKLNEKGKPTRISLSTVGENNAREKKLINSYLFADLEVCNLEAQEYLRLLKVFTHSNIPVQREKYSQSAISTEVVLPE